MVRLQQTGREPEAVEHVQEPYERAPRDRGPSMTARQRQGSDIAAAVVPAELAPANGSANGASPVFRWEAWFAGASPDQRAEALGLAREQGLLYLQQLPAIGSRCPHAPEQPSLVPLLSRLLAGKA